MRVPEQAPIPADWLAARVYLRQYLEATARGVNRLEDGFLFEITTTATNYTAHVNDALILVTANSKTITLPAASSCKEKRFTVKNAGGSVTTTTIQASSGNIDGSASYTTTNAYESIDLVSDGSNYWVI
jgi:hypothetical protein